HTSFEFGPRKGIVSKLPRSSSTLSCIRDCNWRANSIASVSEPEVVTRLHKWRTRSSKVMKHHGAERMTVHNVRCPTFPHYRKILRWGDVIRQWASGSG